MRRARIARAVSRTAPLLALLMSLLAGLLPSSGQAQVRDRRLEWRSVETEHFRVHYPEPLGAVARRVLFLAEHAQRTLAPLLGHEPQHTEIVLSDESDAANGSATSLPYNTMWLFVTAPGDLTPLADYDDWLGVLITHEHTHVVHTDTIRGLPAIVNAILGKTLAPNLVQPRWLIEGLAVHEETHESSAGRIRSAFYDMYMRMEALDDQLLALDRLSNSIDRWPRGTSWYLYGAFFMDWVAARYGREALREMSLDYGRRMISYGVSRTFERATGHGVVELYDEWRAEVRARYLRQRSQIEARGRVEGRRLSHHGEFARRPRWLDAETIVYDAYDGENDQQLRAVPVADPERWRELSRASGETYAAVAPDGTLVYGGADAHRDIYFRYDLFRFDPRTGARTRLTDGWRAREPDVSRDGRRVVFTVNGGGTRHLMIAELADVEGSARPLVRSRRFEQVYTPVFSPDGTQVAYSCWSRGGYRDLRVVDLATGAVRAITRDRYFDSGPEWSHDGRTLYFSSDRMGGVFNLFAYDLEEQVLRQLTNVVGGAFSPALSPDGSQLAYIGYSSRGQDLWTIALSDTYDRPVPSPAEDARESSRESTPFPEGWAAAHSERYRPALTMYPRSWFFEAGSDSFGTQLAILLAGEDAAGFHQWSARVGLSLPGAHVQASAAWTFSHLATPISLSAFRQVNQRSTGLQVAGANVPWIEELYGGSVGLARSIPRAFHSESVGLSYTASYSQALEPVAVEFEPDGPLPRLPALGFHSYVSANWSYSDIRRHLYDMTPSAGKSLGLGLSFAHPVIGSLYRSVRLTWSITGHVEAPWAQHHVFSMRYGGGIGAGDPGRVSTFAIGGFSEADLLTSLLNQSSLGGVALRGYDPFSRGGDQLHLLQLEYRFPIVRIMRGFWTLPLYFRRLYASVFADVGDAFYGSFDPQTLRVGVGAELFLDFTIGYILPFTFRAGFAYGAMEGGGPRFYFHLGRPF